MPSRLFHLKAYFFHRIAADGRTVRYAVPGVVDEQLLALRREAAAAGDDHQVTLCTQALSGNERARRTCARVIDDARRQRTTN